MLRSQETDFRFRVPGLGPHAGEGTGDHEKVRFESGELRECLVLEILERAQRRALRVRETVRFCAL